MADFSNLTLFRNVGDRERQPYTKAEKDTAREVLLGILDIAGLLDDREDLRNQEVPEEVLAAIEAASEAEDLPSIARKAYRSVEASHFDNEGVPQDPANWPKIRDYTSLTLVFRAQLKGLKVISDADLDRVFKKYVPKKGKKSG